MHDDSSGDTSSNMDASATERADIAQPPAALGLGRRGAA